jgi:hypothetical protein
VQSKKADAQGWAETVDKMVQRGLSVSAGERKQIIDYLATR